jgi:hypothetical protein
MKMNLVAKHCVLTFASVPFHPSDKIKPSCGRRPSPPEPRTLWRTPPVPASSPPHRRPSSSHGIAPARSCRRPQDPRAASRSSAHRPHQFLHPTPPRRPRRPRQRWRRPKSQLRRPRRNWWGSSTSGWGGCSRRGGTLRLTPCMWRRSTSARRNRASSAAASSATSPSNSSRYNAYTAGYLICRDSPHNNPRPNSAVCLCFNTGVVDQF